MASLTQGARTLESHFDLLGRNEDAITAAIAWTMRASPAFLAGFLADVCAFSGGVENAQLHLQRHQRGAGRTDLEIVIPGAIHVVLEAKLGWELPGQQQLQTYATRQGFGQGGSQRWIVTLSEADQRYANACQPASVLGIPVSHRSRRDLLKILTTAARSFRRLHEKARLGELAQFLNRTMARPNTDSNWVYVVSLSRSQAGPWQGTTFVDVVYQHKAYFHQVGGSGKWPTTPPNYLAFRFDGALQSIHHVEDTIVSKDLADIAPKGSLPPWPVTDPHFIYRLGPAIRPAAAVPNGAGIVRSMRVWAALDALLTASTIADARKITRARWP